MDFLDNLVLSVNDVLYAYVLIILLVGLGIWFTFRTGFVQLRCIKEWCVCFVPMLVHQPRKTIFPRSRLFVSVPLPV